MDIKLFLDNPKSIVLAPAGYGKTHTIVDCLKAYSGNKHILVLTHTHAGIASIKEKMRKEDVDSSKYHLDTICGFAIRTAKYYCSKETKFPEDSNAYFEFSVKLATRFVLTRPVKTVLEATYDHLIVDEYQDCSLEQHQLILSIANIIHTHLLGDSLQGIFTFNHLIDMDTEPSMLPFMLNKQQLDTPWRWNNVGCPELGTELALVREQMLRGEDLDLRSFSKINYISCDERAYLIQHSICRNLIFSTLARNNSVLLIHPMTKSVNPRLNYLRQFNQLKMIESIDDKTYYTYCKNFDTLEGMDLILFLIQVAETQFKKTIIAKWFNSKKRVKTKHSIADKVIANKLNTYIARILATKRYDDIAKFLFMLEKLPENRCVRYDLMNDIYRALKQADVECISAFEAIKKDRDKIRHLGRRIQGRCIGTTLLTKGLEFDTVIVLNAHQFDDPKNLYVALTRGAKQVIVMSNNAILHPYK